MKIYSQVLSLQMQANTVTYSNRSILTNFHFKVSKISYFQIMVFIMHLFLVT